MLAATVKNVAEIRQRPCARTVLVDCCDEVKIEGEIHKQYGIRLIENKTSVIFEAIGISTKRSDVISLIERLNKHGYDLCSLPEIIEDCVNELAMLS